VQYKNIFGDDFQRNQVSCQHLFRSGGGMHPLHHAPVSAPAGALYLAYYRTLIEEIS